MLCCWLVGNFFEFIRLFLLFVGLRGGLWGGVGLNGIGVEL